VALLDRIAELVQPMLGKIRPSYRSITSLGVGHERQIELSQPIFVPEGDLRFARTPTELGSDRDAGWGAAAACDSDAAATSLRLSRSGIASPQVRAFARA
jgi:hypothetical protein